MAQWASFTQGLHRIADGVHAWLQPDGGWGLNNVGLITSKGESLLIDTPIDLPRTRRMLAAMAAADSAAAKIDTVLITHWHLDHNWGACLLKDSRILASRICADHMQKNPPKRWMEAAAALEGEGRLMMEENLGNKFDFTGVEYIAPTATFEGRTQLTVGDVKVFVVEAKPCHTRSDSVVSAPELGVAHMGDLVSSVGNHVGLQYPFMGNLIDICEVLASFKARVYIPGHGPLQSHADILSFIEYLRFVQAATRERHGKGMSAEEAAYDLMANLGAYKSLKHPERLFFTVRMIYRELDGDTADFVRRNSQEFHATSWRLRSVLPQKFPELYQVRF
jgi:cyclase